MKNEIHPEYHEKTQVSCSCGNTFTTGSTLPEISIEVCSSCHPFYTGKQKLVDTAKRVDKFEARVAKSKELSKNRRGKKQKARNRDQAEKKEEKEKSK